MGVKETITQIYVGYYDRAPDPTGLNYWIGRLNDGMTVAQIAQSFSVQAESTAKYPYLVNPLVVSADSFITNIYQNLFDRAPDDAGKAYWLNKLATGTPVGQMIIDIISGATDSAAGNDKTILENKVKVGIDWAESVGAVVGFEYKTNAEAKVDAAAVLDGVNDTDASVDAAKVKTDNFVKVLDGTAEEEADIAAYNAAKATAATDAADAATAKTAADAANAAYDAAAATVTSKAEADAAKALADASKTAADAALAAANKAKASADAAVAAAAKTDSATDDTDAAAVATAADAAVTAANTAVTDAASDSAAADAAVSSFTSQSFTLTNGADAGAPFTGSAGDDIFTATEATLSSADSLDGAGGNDILNYASSGPGAPGINEAGFMLANIERVNVTSDATGGTVFDVTGSSGINVFGNNNSSRDLQIDGLNGLSALELNHVSGGNTTINYQAAAVAGGADVQSLGLNNVHSNGGLGVSNVTVNGVETLNINTSGAASLLNNIIGADITTVNLTGDQNLTVNNTMPGTITSFNASGLTGGAMFNMNFNAGGVTFNGVGSGGNDTFLFGNTLGADDTVDAGAGDQDTIGFNVIGDVNAGLQLSNFERATFADATGGPLDMNDLPGINHVFLNGGLLAGAPGDVAFNDAQDGLVIELNQVAGAGNGFNGRDVTIDHKTDTASNSATLNVDINTDQTLDVVSLPDAETFSLDIDSNDGNDTLTVNNLLGPDLNGSTLNITGDGHLVLGAATAANLAKIEAGTATGNLNINSLGGAATALTINTGSGNDLVTGSTAADTINTGDGNDVVAGTAGADTINTGAGTDVINGSAGANTVTGGSEADTFVYASGSLAATAGLSNDSAGTDTITDFMSGTDRLNLDGLSVEDGILLGPITTFAAGVGGGSTTFVGNKGTFALAQGALRGGGNADVVYQQDQNILWVDTDGNGTLDNNDFRLVLTGTTSLTQQDLGINLPGVTFTANKNNFNTANTADSNEGVAVGNSNDTINATATQIATGPSTINGLFGTDTLNVTTQWGGGALGTTNVETVNLQQGSTGAATAFNAAVATVTAGKAATVDLAAGNVNYTGSGEVDTVNNASGADVVDTAGGNDTVNVGGAQTGALNGGDGTDTLNVAAGADISGSALSGFELGNLAAGTVTMSAAQHGAFVALNGAGANNVIFSDAFNGTANASIESYDLANANSVFNVNAGATAVDIDENGGINTVNIAGLTVTGDYDTFDANDTLVATTGSDVSGAGSTGAGTALGFGIFNLTGITTMTEAQHNGFTTINAAGGADEINITDQFIGNADNDVELYDLNGVDNTITLNGAGTSVAAGAGDDVVVVNGGTLGGVAINGEGEAGGGNSLTDANDTLQLVTGSNISAANITNFEHLGINNGASVTMNATQFGTFSNLLSGAGAANASGTETLMISTTVNDTDAGTLAQAIENFVLASAGNDVFGVEDVSTSNPTINIAAGGNDTISIDNDAVAAVSNAVVVTGFDVANDELRTSDNGTAHNSGFETVSVADGNIATGADGVLEIASSVTTFLNPTNIADGASVEAALVNSIGSINDGTYTVIGYGNGDAFVYNIEVTDGAGGGAADNALDHADEITVELVGQLKGVAADALAEANFA